MASIYDKALKRKDFSGIIDKDKQTEAAEKKAALTPPNGVNVAGPFLLAAVLVRFK